jgi:multiple sugar transport system substrate-binding protein
MRLTTLRAGSAALLAVSLALTGGTSSNGGTSSAASDSATASNGKPVTLKYTLWVDTQLAAYQACADAFHAQNPNITVDITQLAWGDYWKALTTEMTAGTAPDVFTDSVAYYPDFQANGQIVDLQPYVDRDKVDLTQYQTGLDMWVRDGKRYGLPKDWDAVGLVYNQKMLQDAGVDPASLQNLTWNPDDGGSFEKLIAKLTVDQKGVHGDQPGFDKNHVKTYGIVLDLDAGAGGQTSWGNLAVSTGFQFLDKNPWGTKYNYTDPRLAATISWVKSLADKGYLPKFDQHSSLGSDAVLAAGQAALGMAGSWMASTYLTNTKQQFAFAPLPAGPDGVRTASNSLSDAIWAGSKHKDEAWQWVKYLASPACQDIVASKAVVFPAIKEASAKAMDAFKAKGWDMSAFLTESSQPEGTFLLPLTDHAGDVAQTVQDGLDRVWLGQDDAAKALAAIQKKVDALFQ